MPAPRPSLSFSGGEKAEEFFKRAKRRDTWDGEIGVYSTARYEDGTPVAAVFAWNEFGTARIPERPAFRQALHKINRDFLFKELIARSLNRDTMSVDRVRFGRAMAHAAGTVLKRIIDLKNPPNAPATIAKKRSSNPLVDTTKLARSITWKTRRPR